MRGRGFLKADPRGLKGTQLRGCPRGWLSAFAVIPAQAGIQFIKVLLDPRLRGGDDRRDFLDTLSDASSAMGIGPAIVAQVSICGFY
jgi:hypothetical protein